MVDVSLLRCPRTGQELICQGAEVVSKDGKNRYPVVFGIPDFRLFDPPYMTRQQEFAVCEKLNSVSGSMTYPELLGYLEFNLLKDRPEAAKVKSLQHRLALRTRAPSRLHELVSRVSRAALTMDGRILDLGCGSGEASAAIAQAGAKDVIGIDVSLIELVLAKKLLSESDVSALLVAGCAEALPFYSDTFDFVFSPDVIEHVSDQRQYLMEAKRVLRQGGEVLLNSPNRYSLVCPEPHVGIWFLTFLPRQAIDPVSRILGKGPYVGKRLLSIRELEDMVNSIFPNSQIVGRRANPLATGLLGKLYHAGSPVSERLFRTVCDQHIVLASK